MTAQRKKVQAARRNNFHTIAPIRPRWGRCQQRSLPQQDTGPQTLLFAPNELALPVRSVKIGAIMNDLGLIHCAANIHLAESGPRYLHARGSDSRMIRK